MQTIIHRKDDTMNKEQVMEKFVTELEKRVDQYGGMSEIEKLATTYAKNETDNFIVTDTADLKYTICQGDITLQHESSKYYQDVVDTIMDLRPAKDMNLQEGVSVTGDHRIIPLEGSNTTIEDGRFIPKDGVVGRRPYECKIVTTDKPFLISHREHGNISLPAGKYLVYNQIDAKTQQRVYD